MATNSHNPSPPPPTRLGGFEILVEIGNGGMGTVYRAKQVSLDRTVALKILAPQLTSDAKYTDSFLREARAAARLQHPYIVAVHDAGQTDGQYYYAMEFVGGETLQRWVHREGALPEVTVLGIGICIANALKHGWDEAQLLHRDVKPDNVMVDIKGNVKLCDLGLAKNFGENTMLTLSGKVFGTPQFMSPEQARGDSEIDFRTDIYSLGMTLYYALTANVPFHGGTPGMVMARQISEQLPDPRDVVSDVSLHICRVLEKMLAKDAADRYASWDEVLRDLSLSLERRPPQISLFFKGNSSMKRHSGRSMSAHRGAESGQAKSEEKKNVEMEDAETPCEAPDGAATNAGDGTISPIPPTHVGSTEPAQKSRAAFFIGVGALLLLAIGAGGAFFFFRKPSEKPTQTARQNTDPIQTPAQPAAPPRAAATVTPVPIVAPPPHPISAPPAAEEDLLKRDAIPLQLLEKIRSATVYLKVGSFDAVEATGSGFVMKAVGDTRYIVTNHHVVTDDKTNRTYSTVSAVLGSGTRQERSFPAQVVAADEERDLAVLKIAGPDLPEPLDLSRPSKLVETLPVYIFGFPLGKTLAQRQGNPEVSVSRGAISSIRHDDYGNIAAVQIDSAMSPGNSGGPAVNANGQLVGVCVAGVRGSGIGIAIPPSELSAMLSGCVGGIALRLKLTDNGNTEATATATLIDPLSKMKEVALYYLSNHVPRGLKPDPQGLWAPLPNAQKVPLTINGQLAQGTFQISGPPSSVNSVLVQASFLDGEGSWQFGSPKIVRLDPSGAPSGVVLTADQQQKNDEQRAKAEEIAQRELDRAKAIQGFGDVQNKFVATLSQRDYAAAEKVAEEAAVDPVFVPLRERAVAFGSVARRLKIFGSPLPDLFANLKGKSLSIQGETGVLVEVAGGHLELERSVVGGVVGFSVPIANLKFDEVVSLALMAKPNDKELLLDIFWCNFPYNKSAEVTARLKTLAQAGVDTTEAQRMIGWLTEDPVETEIDDIVGRIRGFVDKKKWGDALALRFVLSSLYGQSKTVKVLNDYESYLRERRTEKTELVGGQDGGAFEEGLEERRVVVGFNFTVIQGGIKTLQAIYMTPNGTTKGAVYGGLVDDSPPVALVAREGYAVGALRVNGLTRINGLEVVFMRLMPGGASLDPSDSYKSKWLGGKGKTEVQQLGGDGWLIIGICGKCGSWCDSIGLIKMVPFAQTLTPSANEILRLEKIIAATIPARPPTGAPQPPPASPQSPLPLLPRFPIPIFGPTGVALETRVKELIVKLGDSDPQVSNFATAELWMIGEPALPFLKAALNTTTDKKIQIHLTVLIMGIEGKPPR